MKKMKKGGNLEHVWIPPPKIRMPVIIACEDGEPLVVGDVIGIPCGAYDIIYQYDDCCSMYPPKPVQARFEPILYLMRVYLVRETDIRGTAEELGGWLRSAHAE
jgi:hypothetical protein